MRIRARMVMVVNGVRIGHACDSVRSCEINAVTASFRHRTCMERVSQKLGVRLLSVGVTSVQGNRWKDRPDVYY